MDDWTGLMSRHYCLSYVYQLRFSWICSRAWSHLSPRYLPMWICATVNWKCSTTQDCFAWSHSLTIFCEWLNQRLVHKSPSVVEERNAKVCEMKACTFRGSAFLPHYARFLSIFRHTMIPANEKEVIILKPMDASVHSHSLPRFYVTGKKRSLARVAETVVFVDDILLQSKMSRRMWNCGFHIFAMGKRKLLKGAAGHNRLTCFRITALYWGNSE